MFLEFTNTKISNNHVTSTLIPFMDWTPPSPLNFVTTARNHVYFPLTASFPR